MTENMSIEQLRAALAEKEGIGNVKEVEAGGMPVRVDMAAAASYKAHRLQRALSKASKAYDATSDESAAIAASDALDGFLELVIGEKQIDAIAERLADELGREPRYEEVVKVCNEAIQAANLKK